MPWLEEIQAHPLLGTGVYLALAFAVVVLRQVAHRSPLGRRLDLAFSFIATGLIVGGIEIAVRRAGLGAATPYLDAMLIGSIAIGVVNAALTLFVHFYLRQRGGAVVSAIFRDIAGLVAYFVVIVVVLRTTLDINVASLIATSAVLTAIIGLALQDLLSNLFSGLVLELEAPFSRGDWVRVGTFEGTIEETGWRTTKLRTRVNEIVTLPNVMLSKEPVVNYSRPDPLFGDTLRFDAAYEAPPNVVKQAVLSVFDADPEVARMPRAEVWVERYGESGVGYAMRYWITRYEELYHVRDRVMTNLWYALHRAGVRIPFPARDLFIQSGGQILAPEPPEIFGTLRSVPLLAPLDDAALGRLAGHVRRLTFGADEIVVREGDRGDSFYVIERGEAEVVLHNGASTTRLDRIAPGGFFGEMSLLAGEPRTATVRAATDLAVLVVGREAFREIISADPALLGPLSEIAAQRQTAQREQRRSQLAQPRENDRQQAQRLLERIKAFFGM